MWPRQSEWDVPALHPRALAYLGDTVFELFVREIAIAQASQTAQLHKFVTDRVNAQFQVQLLEQIEASLTEAETEIVRRGRNVAVSTGRRSQQALHRQATGFEALIGYLYLTDSKRLHDVLDQLKILLVEAPNPT